MWGGGGEVSWPDRSKGKVWSTDGHLSACSEDVTGAKCPSLSVTHSPLGLACSHCRFVLENPSLHSMMMIMTFASWFDGHERLSKVPDGTVALMREEFKALGQMRNAPSLDLKSVPSKRSLFVWTCSKYDGRGRTGDVQIAEKS